MSRLLRTLSVLLPLSISATLACKPKALPRHLVVMAAPSIAAELTPAIQAFEAVFPGTDVRVEWVGSLLACRQIQQGDRAVDVLVVADAELVRTMLAPSLVTSHQLLQTDALVLAFPPQGRMASALAAGAPWQTALLELRIGHANPGTAPLGYRTLMALALNDRSAPDALRVGARIRAQLRPDDQRADAAQVAGMLETGAVDAAFLYGKEARAHGFATQALDAAVNFADASRAEWYASERMSLPDGQGQVRGSVVQYSIATLAGAPEPALARAFAQAIYATRSSL